MKIPTMALRSLAAFVLTVAVLTGCSGSGGNNSNQSQVPQNPGDTSPSIADAIDVTDSSALIQGGFDNPSGYTTTVWLEYGTTSSYGNNISTWPAYATSGHYGVSALFSGLTGSTTYHYRIGTNNAGGTFYSSDKTFTTYIMPVTLVSGGSGSNPYSNGYDNPNSIAVDSTNIFWTDNNGAVSKMGITGGSITTLATGTYSSHIAIDSTNVYWNDKSSILKISKNGGTMTSIVSSASTTATIFDLATDSTNVYWADGFSVYKVGINSGPTTTLGATTSIGFYTLGLATDSASVYWVESPANGWGTTVSTVKKVDLNSGTTTTLTTTPPSPWGYHAVTKRTIAVDPTSVYWTDGFSIYKIGKNGGIETILVAGGGALAVDSVNIYMISSGNNGYGCISCVSKVGLNGGTTKILTCTRDCDIDIAIDTTSVYWITDSSAIKMIAK